MGLTVQGSPATAGPFCFQEAKMPDTVSDLARRLADNAEAVCRHYLSNGRRQGRYWLVGDVHNSKRPAKAACSATCKRGRTPQSQH